MIDQYREVLRKELRERKKSLQERCGAGKAGDMRAYGEFVGRIAEVGECEKAVDAAYRKLLNEDEEDYADI